MRIHDFTTARPTTRLRIHGMVIEGPATHLPYRRPKDPHLPTWKKTARLWTRLEPRLRAVLHGVVVPPVLCLSLDGECVYAWGSPGVELQMSPRHPHWAWWGPDPGLAPTRLLPPWELPPDVLAWLPRAIPGNPAVWWTMLGAEYVHPGWVEKKSHGGWSYTIDEDS